MRKKESSMALTNCVFEVTGSCRYLVSVREELDNYKRLYEDALKIIDRLETSIAVLDIKLGKEVFHD
jgi:hypothetical protein